MPAPTAPLAVRTAIPGVGDRRRSAAANSSLKFPLPPLAPLWPGNGLRAVAAGTNWPFGAMRAHAAAAAGEHVEAAARAAGAGSAC